MDFQKFLKQKIIFFIFSGMIGSFLPVLYAGDPAVALIRARAAALVSVQSSGTVGSLESRLGGMDKVAGHLSLTDRTRPIHYLRNGSGIILDPKGIIVTNDHVVHNAADISVIFSDGTRVRARLIRTFPGNDLAFLSIVPPFALSTVSFADSDKISKGTRIYTIGRSLWHKDTWFRGKITGIMVGMLRGGPHVSLLQLVFGLEFYLGDSGCPIFDSQGKLLGIVIAGKRDGDKATFAVASNFIRDAFQKIREEPARFSRSRPDGNTSSSFLNRMRRISNGPSQLVAVP